MLVRSITIAFLVTTAALASADESKSKYIVGGGPEAGFAAVGALMDGGEQFCTGTLIAPTVVVTAAHCLVGLPGPDGIAFYIGQDANDPASGTMVSAKSLHQHPKYDDAGLTSDIAVILLASAPAGIHPISPQLQPLPDIVGKEALFIGYGLTGPNGSYGDKLSVSIAISKLEDDTLWYEHPSKNTCNGDSGGPALFETNGSWAVIGVTSFGDEACSEFGVNTRVDAFAAWVDEFMDGEAPEGSEMAPGQGGGGDEGDFCEIEGWYGDGICDSDCPKPDSDCADGGSQPPEWTGEGDFCEARGWYGDGICDMDCPEPDTADCGDDSGGAEPGDPGPPEGTDGTDQPGEVPQQNDPTEQPANDEPVVDDASDGATDTPDEASNTTTDSADSGLDGVTDSEAVAPSGTDGGCSAGPFSGNRPAPLTLGLAALFFLMT